jgi:hypothetical protein
MTKSPDVIVTGVGKVWGMYGFNTPTVVAELCKTTPSMLAVPPGFPPATTFTGVCGAIFPKLILI